MDIKKITSVLLKKEKATKSRRILQQGNDNDNSILQ